VGGPYGVRYMAEPAETTDGRRSSAVLRAESAAKAGAGWDVMVLEDGEPLFSRPCVDEKGARYVAESFRQDLVRTGWTAD
jgi:hypothetical protein